MTPCYPLSSWWVITPPAWKLFTKINPVIRIQPYNMEHVSIYFSLCTYHSITCAESKVTSTPFPPPDTWGSPCICQRSIVRGSTPKISASLFLLTFIYQILIKNHLRHETPEKRDFPALWCRMFMIVSCNKNIMLHARSTDTLFPWKIFINSENLRVCRPVVLMVLERTRENPPFPPAVWEVFFRETLFSP